MVILFGIKSLDYSSEIAETGQPAAQAPQLIHVSASMIYVSSPSDIADTGHPSAQEPHLMQSPPITYAILHPSPF